MMRAESKALPMKSKKGMWCGDRRKWAEHRLMPGFDCVSKRCCHRDYIQCSGAQCLPHVPPFSPLPHSFSYLPPLSLCSQEQAHSRGEHRPAALLECYTVTDTERPNTPVSDRINRFIQKQCNTTTQHICPTSPPVGLKTPPKKKTFYFYSRAMDIQCLCFFFFLHHNVMCQCHATV